MDLTRGVDPVLLAALSKPVFHPVLLVHLDWPDDPVHAHSNLGDINWAGETWLGVGELGSIAVDEAGPGIVPSKMSVTLAGLIADQMANVTEDDLRGRAFQAWVGATTEPGGTSLVGAPVSAFSGTMERPVLNISDTGEVSVTIQGITGPPARAGGRVSHSDESHQADYSGDTLFRRVTDAEKHRTNPPTW